ncbi:MAG: response regulator [Deltaproteobacteria bacterium]|nr:response regulator [Deltaproteobacteria bacterium]
MEKQNLLDGKRLLVVDDEPDVLDSLVDLLIECKVTKASSFEQAKDLLENQYFDMAILDIMGVKGYELLEICNQKRVIGVMLTAYAMTPEDIKKSYENGWRWFDRLADYCERKFGPDWQKDHGFKVR